MPGRNETTNSTSVDKMMWNFGAADIAKATACFVVILLSLIGNLLVMLSVKKNLHGKMRTVNSYFIANMSLADFLFSLQNIYSVIVYVMLNGIWSVRENGFGHACCKLDMFTSVVLLTTTVFSLVAIAVDRFCAVFIPMRKIITPRIGNIVLGLTWLISALYSAPLLYFSEIQSEGELRSCGFKEAEGQRLLYWYMGHTGLLALALILILTVYTAIMIKLLQRKHPGNQSETAHKRREKLNRNISKMLVSLVLVFYVCFLPHWIVQLSIHFGFSHLIQNTTFHFVSNFLLLLNGAVNPFVYANFCRNFQMSFKYFLAKLYWYCQKVNLKKNAYTNNSESQSEPRL